MNEQLAVKKEQIPFTIKPLNKKDNYYGFTLQNNPTHVMPNGVIFHNSGKSVMEQGIVGHVSRYADQFQLVGVDCKRVEFNLLRGVKGVKGVALDVLTSAATASNFQRLMMERFKFMEQMQVNNVYKIKDKEVDFYTWAGETYQFDEMFELKVDLDKNDRNYNKFKASYPDERQPIILTIKEIYEGMHAGKWDGRHPQMPEVKGFNSYIDVDSIRKTKGIFKPKILLFLADELNELMTSDDYKSVDEVKQALGSIARLGRAAAVHLALACQRASGSTISTDLKNNIQMSILLGGFDEGSSQLMFEKDISQLAKPHIKGRGFIGQNGGVIIETQTYFTQPENDWVFDENQKLTYDNPVFIEQCKRQKKNFDSLNTGWVPQRRLDEIAEDEIAEDEDLEEPEEITAEDEANMFIDSEEDENEDVFSDKAEDKHKEESKQPGVVADKPPDISMDDLDTLFNKLDNNMFEESEDDEDSEDDENSEDEDSEDNDITDSESEVELKTLDEIESETSLKPEASSNISLDFEDISEPVTVVSEEPKRLKIKIKSDQTPKIKLKANNTIKIKLKKPEE